MIGYNWCFLFARVRIICLTALTGFNDSQNNGKVQGRRIIDLYKVGGSGRQVKQNVAQMVAEAKAGAAGGEESEFVG